MSESSANVNNRKIDITLNLPWEVRVDEEFDKKLVIVDSIGNRVCAIRFNQWTDEDAGRGLLIVRAVAFYYEAMKLFNPIPADKQEPRPQN